MRPLTFAAAATILLLSATAASCDDAPEVALAAATRTTVSEVVEAPASVTAKGSAVVSSPANGTLATLSVAPGQSVTGGQVVAVVDSPEAQARLAQATEALNAAKRSGGGGGGGSARLNLGAAQQHLDTSANAAFAEARAAAEMIPDLTHKQAVLAQIASAQAGYVSVSQNAWQLIRGVERGLASVSSAMRALGAAQVLQAQQAYDLAQSTVDALTLKAPIAGVVQLGGASSPSAPTIPNLPGDLSSLLGAGGGGAPAAPEAGVSNQVSAGAPVKTGTAIATIVDVSELGLVAEVDETDVLLVKEGIRAEAELDAAPGSRLDATVKAIDVLPTPNSRGAVAYKVHLVLSAASIQPRPGMSALVRLRVRQAESAVAVPAAAVFNSDGKDWVWVRSGDGTAQRREVKVGVAGRDLLQIAEGLREGENVVVRGADRVREGDRLP
ncbi:MAG TPA: efflux RND transporter periplasmic adaptor subunit [Candidatus Limnocylindrales bacterium]